ncbi:MAG: PAS domain-containing protein [Cytophagales bacterium]|nr:PAS domain-containing protein [Cytophagales bacterium]
MSNLGPINDQEEFLRSILNSSFDGIMTFKSVRDERQQIVDFEWLFVNQEACQMVGRPSQELLGQKLLELFPGNKEAGLFDRYREVTETGKPATFEQFYPGENLNRWFRISTVKLEDGFTVTFQDISDLKKATEEAAVRDKQYQRLFDESIDPILLLGQDGTFREANQAFQTVFHFSEEALPNVSMKRMTAKVEQGDAFWRDMVQQKRIEDRELFILDAQGNKKTCFINAVAIPTERDEDLLYLLVIRDVTKRNQSEKALVRAEKLSLTGKIARTIAHEVRNPLTNLNLALGQLKDEIPSDVEDADLYLDMISRNADRIGNLINDLLNSAKPKALQLAEGEVTQVVNEAVALIQDRLQLKNMRLELSMTEEIPKIQLDHEQLKVAFLNLFVNALEAMQSETGVLTIAGKTSIDQVIISVKDNGKGIPADQINKLFDPYFTEKRDGTGLGLLAVQNIIHGHRGYIEVDSEPGEGTTFSIYLPLR